MKIMNEKDIGALVISPSQSGWGTVCVTEYLKDGTWVCGMNLITTVENVLDEAYKRKISIIPESCLETSQDTKERRSREGEICL
jgi:hypothetical protein